MTLRKAFEQWWSKYGGNSDSTSRNSEAMQAFAWAAWIEAARQENAACAEIAHMVATGSPTNISRFRMRSFNDTIVATIRGTAGYIFDEIRQRKTPREDPLRHDEF